YQTLYNTLYELSLSMAPFAPFLSETIYQSLRKLSNSDLPSSVHLCLYPESNNNRIKPLLEQAVTRMQHIILLGRQKRNQEKVKTKYPVAKLTVVHRDPELLEEIARLEGYLRDELNTKTVEYSAEESQYIHLYAKPNSPLLGKRLGKDFKTFKLLIEGLDSNTIEQFQSSGSLNLDGQSFQQDDILVFREAREGTNAVSDRFISIDMDCTLNEDLIEEGLAREVINRIQKSRKDSGFNVSDRIRVSINSGHRLLKAIKAHEDYIKRETLTLDMQYVNEEEEMVFDIDGEAMSLSMAVSE
ncbi:MAG: DUF5915 domain-containing protein, partial [Pseudomonadales bacterium]|nr:DUF5915 domain-containing protein [Pseudomonadales bacterium]